MTVPPGAVFSPGYWRFAKGLSSNPPKHKKSCTQRCNFSCALTFYFFFLPVFLPAIKKKPHDRCPQKRRHHAAIRQKQRAAEYSRQPFCGDLSETRTPDTLIKSHQSTVSTIFQPAGLRTPKCLFVRFFRFLINPFHFSGHLHRVLLSSKCRQKYHSLYFLRCQVFPKIHSPPLLRNVGELRHLHYHMGGSPGCN